MTKQFRKKPCSCGGTVLEKAKQSNAQWEKTIYCSKMCRSGLDNSVISKIVYMYAVEELPLEYIGEAFGVSRTSIQTLLNAYNIPPNDKSTFIKVEHRKGIVKLYKETGSSYKVEEKYPYSRKAIDNYLKSVGAQAHRKSGRYSELGNNLPIRIKPKLEQQPIKIIKVDGQEYKKGINNFLFMKISEGNWIRSNNESARLALR